MDIVSEQIFDIKQGNNKRYSRHVIDKTAEFMKRFAKQYDCSLVVGSYNKRGYQIFIAGQSYLTGYGAGLDGEYAHSSVPTDSVSHQQQAWDKFRSDFGDVYPSFIFARTQRYYNTCLSTSYDMGVKNDMLGANEAYIIAMTYAEGMSDGIADSDSVKVALDTDMLDDIIDDATKNSVFHWLNQFGYDKELCEDVRRACIKPTHDFMMDTSFTKSGYDKIDVDSELTFNRAKTFSCGYFLGFNDAITCDGIEKAVLDDSKMAEFDDSDDDTVSFHINLMKQQLDADDWCVAKAYDVAYSLLKSDIWTPDVSDCFFWMTMQGYVCGVWNTWCGMHASFDEDGKVMRDSDGNVVRSEARERLLSEKTGDVTADDFEVDVENGRLVLV